MPIPSGAPSGLLPSLLASGFPFQTAIAKLIQQTKHWKVTNEEFPWRDGDGAEHFLDITAATPLMVAAIECKKTRADVLTFLNPNRSNTTTHVRCTFIMQIQDSTKRMERFCTDWEMSPASYEAMFCVVSTSASGKDQRMLERDAHLLVAATDSYGSYHGMRYKPEFGTLRFLICRFL